MSELNKVTLPPEHLLTHEWHWLYSERASQPVCSQWLGGRWYSPGETQGIYPVDLAQRGWKYLAPAVPPKLPMDEEMDEDELHYIPKGRTPPKRDTLPDFGLQVTTLFKDTDYPIEVCCKNVAPGITFNDLVMMFNEAEKEWKPEDNLSGNAAKWKNARGIHAIVHSILHAIYVKVD